MRRLFNWLCVLFLPLWAAASPKVFVAIETKNDEDTIYRCLDSVKHLADYVYVADKNSIDGTAQLFEEFLDEYNIQGSIEQRPEEPFEMSREQSLTSLRKSAERAGFDLNQTYFLFLEPTMRVELAPDWDKEALTLDSYWIFEKWPHLSHSRRAINLIRASLPWKQTGILRDEWRTENAKAAPLKELWIDNQVDEKQERLRQEIKVLNDVLKKEPENPKAQFLLAQAYKAAKDYPEAIHQFKARIKIQGEPEENWFSKYMLAQCYEESGDWTDALYWYLDAFQDHSARAEPLKKISHYYRVRGENDLAYLFAKHATRIPYPDDGTLFDELPFNPYQVFEDLSIAAYYTQFKDEGFAAANQVLLTRSTPWFIKDHTYRNILFYTQNLPKASFVPLMADLPPIEDGSDELYRPMNPSIVRTEKGYKLVLRSVNYTQTGAKIFNTNDSRGIFRTRNFLLDLDPHFRILTQNEIVEDLPREKNFFCGLEGLEDCRLVEHQGSLWFTCTTADTNPTGQRQISLCKLESAAYDGIHAVEELTPLLGPDLNRCEKNWLPFIQNDSLYIVYSCDPFTLMKPDPISGVCKTVLQYQPERDFSRFRGSAGPTPFDGGYLMLVHENVQRYDHTRVYLHRFVYLDSFFQITKISKPFTFRHQGVEFCCSMTLDHSGKTLILPIGIEDSEAYLCLIGTDTVRSLLEPLSQ